MKKPLVILCFLFAIAMTVAAFPDGLAAVLLTIICSAVVILTIRQQAVKDADYLIQLFLLALMARLVFGLFLQIFDIREFFGGDAITYDSLGYRLVEIWLYDARTDDIWSQRALATSGSGWGMNRLVAVIYLFTGRNILAAQSFCAVIGAATVPMIYNCAVKVFNNRRVGKVSALLVALYPAFIIWTGQLLKDGLIIFLLVLVMTLVVRLQERFRYTDVILLIFSLSAILSLRFYIFYIAVLAVVGAFVVGTGGSSKSILQRLAILSVVGIAMLYLGVLGSAGEDLERYGNLERIQVSRQDLASSAESGFGEDIDVSTTQGAVLALPIGFLYLMLAPFPWQMTSFRQMITMPEVFLWWLSIPLMLSGLVYTIKNRLRQAIPILIFSLLLTMAYSLFSGNVGTAYRQRTQIQVFLFIFIGVGWTLVLERQENKKMRLLADEERLRKKLLANTYRNEPEVEAETGKTDSKPEQNGE
jgi:hypothetical protein